MQFLGVALYWIELTSMRKPSTKERYFELFYFLFIYFINRKETDCQVFYPSKAINRKTATCHSEGIRLLNVFYCEGFTYHDHDDYVYLMQFIQIDM